MQCIWWSWSKLRKSGLVCTGVLEFFQKDGGSLANRHRSDSPIRRKSIPYKEPVKNHTRKGSMSQRTLPILTGPSLEETMVNVRALRILLQSSSLFSSLSQMLHNTAAFGWPIPVLILPIFRVHCSLFFPLLFSGLYFLIPVWIICLGASQLLTLQRSEPTMKDSEFTVANLLQLLVGERSVVYVSDIVPRLVSVAVN